MRDKDVKHSKEYKELEEKYKFKEKQLNEYPKKEKINKEYHDAIGVVVKFISSIIISLLLSITWNYIPELRDFFNNNNIIFGVTVGYWIFYLILLVITYIVISLITSTKKGDK